MYRLLTFPLVTVAAINGHGMSALTPTLMLAFAGGFILAMSCDFRLMTSGRGLMCMNEVCL
jgi:enoyl-CoA hydratase/carnithine racemase